LTHLCKGAFGAIHIYWRRGHTPHGGLVVVQDSAAFGAVGKGEGVFGDDLTGCGALIIGGL